MEIINELERLVNNSELVFITYIEYKPIRHQVLIKLKTINQTQVNTLQILFNDVIYLSDNGIGKRKIDNISLLKVPGSKIFEFMQQSNIKNEKITQISFFSKGIGNRLNFSEIESISLDIGFGSGSKILTAQ